MKTTSRHVRLELTCCARGLLLLGLAVAAASCDEGKDETRVQPGTGSGGTGSGGTGGSAGGGVSGSGGASGSGGSLDAGLDATVDATTPGGPCLDGTLEEYCQGDTFCPSLAEAWGVLRRDFPPIPSSIVQRPCAAPDGSPRVAVSADFRIVAVTFVYDPETGQLVGVQTIEDADGSACDASIRSYYGAAAPDCGSGFGNKFIPDACPPRLRDAGVGDAGTDAGPYGGIYECILTE